MVLASSTFASSHLKRTQRFISASSVCAIPQATPATVLRPISAGETIPNVRLAYFDNQNSFHEEMSHDIFGGKRVCLVGVPGAFLPTCSMKHIPSFIEKSDALRTGKDIDEIMCVSVNDVFVMDAWGKVDRRMLLKEDHEYNRLNRGWHYCSRTSASMGADRAGMVMLADGCGQFALAMGVELDLTDKAMGIRSRRYSMIVDDLKIEALHLEEGGAYSVSDADTMLQS